MIQYWEIFQRPGTSGGFLDSAALIDWLMMSFYSGCVATNLPHAPETTRFSDPPPKQPSGFFKLSKKDKSIE